VNRTSLSACCLLSAVLCLAVGARAAQDRALTVSVASSLTDVIGDLAKRYEAGGGPHVQINAAASNTLARQIVEGAPVDLFISADEAQVNAVVKAGRVVAGSERPLLLNHLAVVTSRTANVPIRAPRDLASARVRRIAMGQPDSVPAGVYGRQWLEKIGLWKSIEPKVIPMPTVRAALAAAREGRVDAAIVYVTDARTTADVVIAYSVPPVDAPAIVYPAAIIDGPRKDAATRFLAYLESPDARAVFEAAGFGVLPRR
jgi:molybdate transport system substrate-binding protein